MKYGKYVVIVKLQFNCQKMISMENMSNVKNKYQKISTTNDIVCVGKVFFAKNLP